MTQDFDDFLRERTGRGEPTRRFLIGVLAGTCIALAVLNVVVALWLSSERARSEPPPPSASMPSVILPTTTEPAPADPRASAAPGRTPRAEPPGVLGLIAAAR